MGLKLSASRTQGRSSGGDGLNGVQDPAGWSVGRIAKELPSRSQLGAIELGQRAYAMTELVGGVFYFNYPGGSGLINGSVFGKLAGEAEVQFTAEGGSPRGGSKSGGSKSGSKSSGGSKSSSTSSPSVSTCAASCGVPPSVSMSALAARPRMSGEASASATASRARSARREYRQGDHICVMYETPAEQLAVAVDYIADGLRRNERCLYSVATQAGLDTVAAAGVQ